MNIWMQVALCVLGWLAFVYMAPRTPNKGWKNSCLALYYVLLCMCSMWIVLIYPLAARSDNVKREKIGEGYTQIDGWYKFDKKKMVLVDDDGQEIKVNSL